MPKSAFSFFSQSYIKLRFRTVYQLLEPSIYAGLRLITITLLAPKNKGLLRQSFRPLTKVSRRSFFCKTTHKSSAKSIKIWYNKSIYCNLSAAFCLKVGTPRPKSGGALGRYTKPYKVMAKSNLFNACINCE